MYSLNNEKKGDTKLSVATHKTHYRENCYTNSGGDLMQLSNYNEWGENGLPISLQAAIIHTVSQIFYI